MEKLWRTLLIFLSGVRDCFTGILFVKKFRPVQRKGSVHRAENFFAFPALLKELVQCFGLNGIAFGLSIYAFNNIFLPSIQGLAAITGAELLWSWLQPLMSYTFSAFWVLPLLVLGKILNYVWFQDIADLTFEISCGPKQIKHSFSYLIADMFCSMIFQSLFLVQSSLFSRFPIPIIGEVIWLFHLCLLYSLYAFEYKWFNMGWPIHRRLAFIDYNWPYFLGFGLPLALVTDFMTTSYIASVCVFSVLFPLYVISGTNSTPVLGEFKCRPHIFAPVIFISNIGFEKVVCTLTNIRFDHNM